MHYSATHYCYLLPVRLYYRTNCYDGYYYRFLCLSTHVLILQLSVSLLLLFLLQAVGSAIAIAIIIGAAIAFAFDTAAAIVTASTTNNQHGLYCMLSLYTALD
jgi:hypothetical protein